MTIYFVIVFLALLVLTPSLIEWKQTGLLQLIRKPFFLILTLFLIVVYFTRASTVGTDYQLYNDLLYYPVSLIRRIGIENGFVEIYKIAQNFGGMIFFNCVVIGLLVLGIWLFSRSFEIPFDISIAFTVLTYFYFFSLNTVRQIVAIGIIMGAMSLFGKYAPIKNKVLRFIAYFALVFIASQFHGSAWITLSFPFLVQIKATPKLTLSFFIVTSVFFFLHLAQYTVSFIVRFAPHYVEKYGSSDSAFFYGGSKGVLEYVPIFIQFILLLFIEFDDSNFIKNNSMLASGYLIFLLLYAGGGIDMFNRIQMVFMPFVVGVYGKYVADQQGSGQISLNYFKLAIVAFWVLYSCLRILKNIGGIVPFVIS